MMVFFQSARDRLGQAYEQHIYRYYALSEQDYRAKCRMAVFLILVLGGGAALWLGTAIYGRYEHKTHLRQARESLAHGEIGNASMQANLALEYRKDDPDACLVLAEIAAREHSPTEVQWRQRVAQARPTLQNKLAVAAAALVAEPPPYPLAAQILRDTAPLGQTNAAFQALLAKIALLQNRPAEAEAAFVAASKLDPANQEYALNVAILRLKSAPKEGKTQAREQVRKLGADEPLRTLALRALVADILANDGELAAEPYSAQLAASPQATLGDRLQYLGITQHRKDEAFSAGLLAIEIEAKTSPADVVEVSNWMRAHGLVAENVDWLIHLPASTAAARPVAMALAQGYLENGNWRALLNFGSHANWEEADFLRLAMISHAWAQLGMSALADDNWTQAVGKAGDHYEALTNLLCLAETWRLKPEEADLRQRLRQFPQSYGR